MNEILKTQGKESQARQRKQKDTNSIQMLPYHPKYEFIAHVTPQANMPPTTVSPI